MSDKSNSQGNFDDAIAALRENARKNVKETSASQKELRTPKEMKGRRPAWVMRGLIAALALTVVAEVFILFGNRNELDLMKYKNGPPVETYAEPVNEPLPAPTEIVLMLPPEEPLLEAPEPTPIPLPEGVEEIP